MIYMYACMYACMHVCMYACMHACYTTYTYVYLFIHIVYTYTFTMCTRNSQPVARSKVAIPDGDVDYKPSARPAPIC